MINKNEMRKESHRAAIEGAFIEEILVTRDKFKTIRNEIYHQNREFSFFRSRNDNQIEIKTIMNDIVVCESCINFSKEQEIKAKPYTEYIEENNIDKKIIPFDVAKVDCAAFNLYINLNIETKSDDRYSINKLTETRYDSIITIAIPMEDLNNGVYMYIVQCIDASLPIVLISKKKLADDCIGNIKDYLFDGTKKLDMYCTYYHPYTMERTRKEYFSSVAYGEPFMGCQDLEFEEFSNDLKYENSDGIKANYTGDKIKVYNNSYLISEYDINDYKDDITNVKFVKDMKDIDIFNSLYHIDDKVSFEKLLDNYPELKKFMAMFSYNFDNATFEHIDPEDLQIDFVKNINDYDNIYRTSWTGSSDSIFSLVLSITDKYFEMFVSINKSDNLFYYYNIETEEKLDIRVTNFEQNVSTSVYHSTNNRSINYNSAGRALFTFKPNYFINVSDGIILDSNLPIKGILTKYNMFGVPYNIKDF